MKTICFTLLSHLSTMTAANKDFAMAFKATERVIEAYGKKGSAAETIPCGLIMNASVFATIWKSGVDLFGHVMINNIKKFFTSSEEFTHPAIDYSLRSIHERPKLADVGFDMWCTLNGVTDIVKQRIGQIITTSIDDNRGKITGLVCKHIKTILATGKLPSDTETLVPFGADSENDAAEVELCSADSALMGTILPALMEFSSTETLYDVAKSVKMETAEKFVSLFSDSDCQSVHQYTANVVFSCIQ